MVICASFAMNLSISSDCTKSSLLKSLQLAKKTRSKPVDSQPPNRLLDNKSVSRFQHSTLTDILQLARFCFVGLFGKCYSEMIVEVQF